MTTEVNHDSNPKVKNSKILNNLNSSLKKSFLMA